MTCFMKLQTRQMMWHTAADHEVSYVLRERHHVFLLHRGGVLQPAQQGGVASGRSWTWPGPRQVTFICDQFSFKST